MLETQRAGCGGKRGGMLVWRRQGLGGAAAVCKWGPALSDLSVSQGKSEIWEKVFILKCWKLIKISFNYCASNKICLWTVI